jgi:hypothetical protein
VISSSSVSSFEEPANLKSRTLRGAGHRPWNTRGKSKSILLRLLTGLEFEDNLRDLALFNLAIDSKLRGCDLVRLMVGDLVVGGTVHDLDSVNLSNTGRPVQFEASENTRRSVLGGVTSPAMLGCEFLFPSRFHGAPHLSIRQPSQAYPTPRNQSKLRGAFASEQVWFQSSA